MIRCVWLGFPGAYHTPFETGDRWSKQYTFVILVEYDLNVIVKAIFGANFISHGSILKKINF